jgi:hypothetical protein
MLGHDSYDRQYILFIILNFQKVIVDEFINNTTD